MAVKIRVSRIRISPPPLRKREGRVRRQDTGSAQGSGEILGEGIGRGLRVGMRGRGDGRQARSPQMGNHMIVKDW
ncbi:hypothetical protein TB1_024982 [Malus domestica]